MNTEVPCKGCQCEFPSTGYDMSTQKPTWFGKWVGQKLVEWICLACWINGIRYTEKPLDSNH